MGNEREVQQAIRVDRERGLFKVARNAFVDPAVLQGEYDRIFDHCWLYALHASELSRPGAFLTRTVAKRNLLFTRDASGNVNAFFNTCPHRGSTVCRDKAGTAKSFQCFYHGWVFGNDGALKGQPGSASYSGRFNESGEGNLVRVPRLEVHADFWFVCFDADAPPLTDYLGGAGEYLQLVAQQSELGMAIVSGTQEYSIRANWKLLTENSIDGYHAETTHATYIDYLKNTNGSLVKVALEGVARDLGNGHAVLEYKAPWGRPIAQWIPLWGEDGRREIDDIHSKLVTRFGEDKARRVAQYNRNLLIFPNLIVNDIMAITVRTYYPVAPNSMMVNAWALGPKEESEWARKFRLYNFLEFLGPGGFATPDDVEALESCQRGYENTKEAGWNDISKGMDNPAPSFDDELQMRVFWSRWDQYMNGQGAKGASA